MAIEIEAKGRFGNALYEAMSKQNIDVKTLAAQVESTYEHIRKLIKGMAYPSEHMLIKLSPILKVKQSDLSLLVDEDRAKKKYGKNFQKMSGKNPELDPIEAKWPALTEEQKSNIYLMVDVFAKQNHGAAKSARK